MPEIHDPNPEHDQKRRNRLFGGSKERRRQEQKPCPYQPFIDGNVTQLASKSKSKLADGDGDGDGTTNTITTNTTAARRKKVVTSAKKGRRRRSSKVSSTTGHGHGRQVVVPVVPDDLVNDLDFHLFEVHHHLPSSTDNHVTSKASSAKSNESSRTHPIVVVSNEAAASTSCESQTTNVSQRRQGPAASHTITPSDSLDSKASSNPFQSETEVLAPTIQLHHRIPQAVAAAATVPPDELPVSRRRRRSPSKTEVSFHKRHKARSSSTTIVVASPVSSLVENLVHYCNRRSVEEDQMARRLLLGRSTKSRRLIDHNATCETTTSTATTTATELDGALSRMTTTPTKPFVSKDNNNDDDDGCCEPKNDDYPVIQGGDDNDDDDVDNDDETSAYGKEICRDKDTAVIATDSMSIKDVIEPVQVSYTETTNLLRMGQNIEDGKEGLGKIEKPMDMPSLVQRLDKKHKVMPRNRKRSRPESICATTTTTTTTAAATTTKTLADHVLTKCLLIPNHHPLPVATVVTQQPSIRRQSSRDWITKLAKPMDSTTTRTTRTAAAAAAVSPRKGASFESALRKTGTLNRESFRRAKTSLRIRSVVAVTATPTTTATTTVSGWRSDHLNNKVLVRTERSDDDAMDRFHWEAALLTFANSKQNELQFPIPVKLVQQEGCKNYVSLTVELKEATIVLGTLADTFQLHCNFGMNMIPESVIGWLVVEMSKILNSLHQVGIAHNDLGLDSFLVLQQGKEWSLILVGLGAKGVVCESGAGESHFRHDRCSVAAIVWSFLTGGRRLSFTNHTDGKLRVDGIDAITDNCFLRGADGWDELFDGLLNPSSLELIPKRTLRLVQGIVDMGRPDRRTRFATPIAVRAFFESLLGHKVGGGGSIPDSRRRFSCGLGISSDELILRLQLEQLDESAASRNHKHSPLGINSDDLSMAPMQEAEASAPIRIESNARKRITAPSGKISVASSPDTKASGIGSLNGPKAVAESVTKMMDREAAPNQVSQITIAVNTDAESVPKHIKRSKASPDNAELPFAKSRASSERRNSAPQELPVSSSHPVLKRLHSAFPKLLRATKKQEGSRRVSVRIQTRLYCGKKGCHNEFPTGRNGCMWVMMIPHEDEGQENLPKVPTDQLMHLVCLSCEPCPKKYPPIIHPARVLTSKDKQQIKGWDKYRYYKASKLEYDKAVHVEEESVTL